MKVYQSCHDRDVIEGVPRIDARTTHKWAKRVGKKYVDLTKIDIPTMIDTNRRFPVADETEVIVLDYEPDTLKTTYWQTLENVLLFVDFYRQSYPGKIVLPYRQLPRIEFNYFTLRDALKSYEHLTAYSQWLAQSQTELCKRISRAASGLTVRAFMVYPNKFDEWVGIMDRYFGAAHEHGVPVYGYVCRHYIDDEAGGKPVEPEIFATAIELCKSRWNCAGAINWVDTENDTAQMPVYGEIIKRANGVELTGKVEHETR